MSSAPASVAVAHSSGRSSSRFTGFAWGVLGYNILVVLWGAVVRATSSGAGCGDHWPLCNGVVLQTHPRLATIIELAHRMSSGLTVPLVLILLVWAFRATVAGHLARVTAIAATVLTLNEGLLGALLVLLKLTANNRSPARAVYLSLHLANTLLLLAALALTAHLASRSRAMVWRRGWAFTLFGLVATLIVGASGSIAALSDTLYPSSSLRAALAQDFSGSGDWLMQVRIVHPLTAVMAGIFIIWLLWRSVGLRFRAATGLLLGLQFVLGIGDVLLLAPVWMQVLHLLGADLLWVGLVLLSAEFCLVEA